MKHRAIYSPSVLFLLNVSLVIAGCGSSGNSSTSEPEPLNDGARIEHLSGGGATVFNTTPSAFSKRSRNINDVNGIRDFNIGNDFFENPWVQNRASTSMRDGLGAHFNNNACQDCHIRDGRGHAPNVSTTENGTDFSSILIRASRSVVTPAQQAEIEGSLIANVPDSSVGGQLQHQANIGVRKETSLSVSYNDKLVTFADGFAVTLREPVWSMTSNYAADGYDFNSDTVFSARVASPMIGLGLLALIDSTDITANADPQDADNNGISGKANIVWSIVDNNTQLGRFGWKAGQPSLRQQSAGAFNGDMGLTSELFPTENCMPHQTDCLAQANGNGDSTASYNFEVSTQILGLIEFYSHHLAVPARRNAYSDEVQKGKQLFNELGCAACHTPSYTTGNSASHPALSNQAIFPYTDLLLHDMGEALADFDVGSKPVSNTILVEFLANSHEWRTPPLWGLGLTKTVDPNATFLHDGRARTILEAVLWHGGEAKASQQAVLQLTADQRALLLAFLNDL